MDPNLLYWKTHGRSFLARLRIWCDVLDPSLLASTDAEIQQAHAGLGRGEELQVTDGGIPVLSLSSVQSDSGAVLPLLFRPNAFVPISLHLVIAGGLPYSRVMPALISQLLLQSYMAWFNHANRNSSSEQRKTTSLEQLLLMAGTVSYTTCGGALPQIFINRLRIRSPPIQTFVKSMSIPLSAVLAFLSVLTVRSKETETGIQVFDSKGNPVGFSKAAGRKAVRETAVSRAALFGLTAPAPLLIQRFFQRRSLLVAPVTLCSVLLVGLTIPVSFSLYPQLGAIKREKVEEELRVAADGERQFYYHRGL